MESKWFYYEDSTSALTAFPTPAIQERIENAFINGHERATIEQFELNLKTMTLLSVEGQEQEKRLKRDKLNPTPTEIWEWCQDENRDKWSPYSFSDCDLLSIISSNGLNKTVFVLDTWPYEIDCVFMIQKNLYDPDRVRKIRKRPFSEIRNDFENILNLAAASLAETVATAPNENNHLTQVSNLITPIFGDNLSIDSDITTPLYPNISNGANGGEPGVNPVTDPYHEIQRLQGIIRYLQGQLHDSQLAHSEIIEYYGNFKEFMDQKGHG